MSHDSANHSASMFATPDEAIKAPQEQYLYVACLHEGTGVDKPDFLAVVGTEPDTPEYGKIISELPPPSFPSTFPINALFTPRAMPMRVPLTSRPKMVPAQCVP